MAELCSLINVRSEILFGVSMSCVVWQYLTISRCYCRESPILYERELYI